MEIAKALLGKPRVLIMDEPTATLTVQQAKRLLEIMRDLVNQGISIIFISHHLDEVFDIADTIVCLRDGECVGSWKDGELSRDELIRIMVGRDLSFAFPPEDRSPSTSVLLDVRSIQRKPHLPENSFRLREGEILGVAGLVGSGRTKMIRAIMGADRAYRHDVTLRGESLRIHCPADAQRAGIGLVPEDRKKQGLVLGASVRENLLLAGLKKLCHPVWRYVQRGKVVIASNEQIQRLQIKTASQHQATQTLSGGNQQKVVLGKWLLAECRVLILDEPTRGIDVGAKGEIYHLLRELRDRGVSILLISSEVPEVIGMSDRVMVMRNQQIVHVFNSKYTVTEEAIMSHAAGGVCAQDVILELEQVRSVRRSLQNARVAIVGISSLNNSAFAERGTLTDDMIAELQAAGAVGEICGRFFNANGEECATPWADRVVSIALDELRQIPRVLAVASAGDRSAAIHAAARGGLIKELLIDERGARSLLEFARQSAGGGEEDASR